MINETNNEQNVTNHLFFRANYSLFNFIFFSLITFGIYGIYTNAKMADDLNLIATRYDGKKTMNFWLLFLIISPVTCGIGGLIWSHKFSERIGDEQVRRGLQKTVSASTFWLWNVLGLLIIVGPFIYMYKIMKAMNGLEEDFNVKGK